MTVSAKDLYTYINQLTPGEKKELALALRKQLLLADAQRLSSFKPRKKISVQEIVKEVRIVRHERNVRKNRS